MKKTIASVALALAITAFASTSFANGSGIILDRIEKQNNKAAVFSVHSSGKERADITKRGFAKTGTSEWRSQWH